MMASLYQRSVTPPPLRLLDIRKPSLGYAGAVHERDAKKKGCSSFENRGEPFGIFGSKRRASIPGMARHGRRMTSMRPEASDPADSRIVLNLRHRFHQFVHSFTGVTFIVTVPRSPSPPQGVSG